MRLAIAVWTYFDCTATGVRGRFHSGSGETQDQWLFRRHQQQNWETLQQCVSLRCQPLNITDIAINPYGEHNAWGFAFETDRDEIFLLDQDPLGLLKKDCQGVPMIAGLGETWRESFLMPYLMTYGEKQNIWFEVI